MDHVMVKRVLMIAFHFPPFSGSSGILRTLKFARYLPESGWQPIVLTPHVRAYANTSDEQLAEIPEQVSVHPAFCLDSSRHLAFRGRYLRLLTLPDRWVSWWFGAIPAGIKLIRKLQPAIIWSTYPIATAHLIALTLHRLTGIPWVADMRDPMTDEVHPSHPLTRRAYQWIERKTLAHCTRAVCTTPGTIRIYRERYPDIPASRYSLIENGYDEENFAAAAAGASIAASGGKPFVLLHSGVVYPSERDPTQLFEALASLAQEGKISAATFQLVLRAGGHDEHLGNLITRHGVASLVKLAPALPYREALSEMLSADGLLLLQASNCNSQIPAKLYEYLRAQRPVLGLTDPIGNTAGALIDAGIDTIAPLDSTEAIRHALLRFLDLAKLNEAPVASMEKVLANARQARTRELALLLDMVAQEAGQVRSVANA
ncbi:MAG: glycosyltransferase [Pseudomonadota bacterium]